MKLFLRYLRGYRKIFYLLAVFCLLFFSCFSLYHLPLQAVIYPMVLCFGIGMVFFGFDFVRVKHEHEEMKRLQLITDLMVEHFQEDKTIKEEDYHRILQMLCEEYKAYQKEMNDKYENMIEYYTVWAHQMKTPIASMRLHLQNEDSDLARKLTAELHRIEQYAEMVLTFVRLDSDSTDYVFKTHDLDKIVKQAIRKFSSEFIGRKLSLVYEPLHMEVVTDEKWLAFVIEQVLSNALKYTPSGSITISLVEEKILRIRDTGIGIASEDLPRIFENGYTGYNGRTDCKASGIGLYLCKRICTNLGHKISVSSTVDVGTAIDIDLSQTELQVE